MARAPVPCMAKNRGCPCRWCLHERRVATATFLWASIIFARDYLIQSPPRWPFVEKTVNCHYGQPLSNSCDCSVTKNTDVPHGCQSDSTTISGSRVRLGPPNISIILPFEKTSRSQSSCFRSSYLPPIYDPPTPFDCTSTLALGPSTAQNSGQRHSCEVGPRGIPARVPAIIFNAWMYPASRQGRNKTEGMSGVEAGADLRGAL